MADEGRLLRRCSTCGQEGLNVKLTRCTGCPKPIAPRYCSKACQRKDWKAWHKLVCGPAGRAEAEADRAEEEVPSSSSAREPERVDRSDQDLVEKSLSGIRNESIAEIKYHGRKVVMSDLPDLISILRGGGSSCASMEGRGARREGEEGGERTLEAILALTSLASDPGNNAAIFAAGAVAPLFALMTQRVEMVGPAHFALKILTYQLGQESFSHLIRLMGPSSSAEEQEMAAVALSVKFTQLSDVEEIGSFSEAIPSLVALLGSGVARVQEGAARALAWLALDADCKFKAAAAGALPPLIALLGSETTSAPALQTRAAEVLVLLTGIDKIAVEVASPDTGAIPAVVGLLGPTASEELRKHALKVIMNMASACANDARTMGVLTVTALAPLIHLLGPPTSAVDQSKVLLALHLLTAGNRNRAKLAIVKGAIPPLVALLGSETVRLQEGAVGILADLADRDDLGGNKILEVDGIPPLVRLLSSRSTEVHEKAAMALWYLFMHCKARLKWTPVLAGSVAPLVALFSSMSDVAKSAAASAFLALTAISDTALSEARKLAAAAGAVPALIPLLVPRRTERPRIMESVQTAAAGALAALAKGGHRNEITRLGAIPPLVALLSSGALFVQHVAISALLELAGSGVSGEELDCKARIAAAGAIPPLVALLSSEEAAARDAAIVALCHRAIGNPANRAAIKKAGAVPVLQRMSSVAAQKCLLRLANG